MLTEAIFPHPADASAALAHHIAHAIQQRLATAAETALVVSGGSTPENCYRELASTDLPWHRVHVVLSDERCVPPDHPASNEGMIRRILLQGHAKAARFVSLFDGELPPDRRVDLLRRTLGALPLPFAATLLGMGVDGHFASLFPATAGLSEGLNLDSDQPCLVMEPAASPQARITLTLTTLLQSDEILLLFFGADKRAVFEEATRDPDRYPVGRLLHQQRTPVRVFSAPWPALEKTRK